MASEHRLQENGRGNVPLFIFLEQASMGIKNDLEKKNLWKKKHHVKI